MLAINGHSFDNEDEFRSHGVARAGTSCAGAMRSATKGLRSLYGSCDEVGLKGGEVEVPELITLGSPSNYPAHNSFRPCGTLKEGGCLINCDLEFSHSRYQSRLSRTL